VPLDPASFYLFFRAAGFQNLHTPHATMAALRSLLLASLLAVGGFAIPQGPGGPPGGPPKPPSPPLDTVQYGAL
jgi:hypothetical protein